MSAIEERNCRSYSHSKIDIISKVDSNPQLEEMRKQLEAYKNEFEESSKNEKKISNLKFKKNLFSCLENLLLQVVYIKEKKLRQQKIETIYKWFQNKKSFFESVNPINTRTNKNFYEVYPKISQEKSNYYEARNYPIEFEKEHRTEEVGILPPKDRLKEYITKKIIKPEEKLLINHDVGEEDNFKEINEKQRLQSATSSIQMRSTFYTANQTMNKFNLGSINNLQQNNDTPFDFKREIKSSYSYFRPKYDYPHLVIEKQIIQAKNREIDEKRNQEEMKEYLNEFGLDRARYKEEVEKKYELKKVIKYYEEIIKKDKEEQPQEIETKREYEVKTIIVDNINEVPKTSQFHTENFNEPDKDSKIDLMNVKNLDSEGKLKVNYDEIKINIKVKSVNSKDKTLNDFKNKLEKIPSEATAKMKVIDPVFGARQTYSKMLDIQEIDNPKNEYQLHCNPLSAYDNTNVEVIGITPEKKINKSRPSTGYEYVRDNFERDNLLKQRKTLSNFKINDYSAIKDKLMQTNTNFNLSALKAAFLPNFEEIRYPKFFLPNSSAGLLIKPAEAQTGKRLKSSKKKKK